MSKNTLSSDLNASERAAMNTNGSVVLVEDDAGLAHALITLLEFDQYEVGALLKWPSVFWMTSHRKTVK